jgi:flagellar hook-associated protein 1 FlgK
MTSLLSILNTGSQSLDAAQLELDVTSNNISNANTAGYSREVVEESPESQQDGMLGQIGTGVDTTGIERLRDTFVDAQIQDQTQQQGSLQQQSTALTSIESIFNEPSDSGLQSSLDTFFSDWQNVANSPEDSGARATLVTDATSLTDQFHSMSSALGTLESQQNGQIVQTVSQVNGLLQQIASLNGAIGSVQQDSTNQANSSLDQQDALLTQLAGLMNISTSVNSSGQVTVSSGGTELVSPLDCKQLATVAVPGGGTGTAQNANVSIRIAGTQQAFTPQGGQLQGLIDTRDTIIPGYESQLDALANGLVSGVNALQEQGYTLNNTTGIPFFSASTTGASDIALSSAITDDPDNIAAAGGGASLTAVANTLAAGTHNFGTSPVQLDEDPSSTPPVAATNIVSGSVSVSAGTTQLTEGVDYQINYADGTIQMLSNAYDGDPLTVNFNYQAGGSKGPGDNTTALAIANLANQPSMSPDSLGNPTATFTDYYSTTVAQLGSAAGTTASQLTATQALITQYQTQQNSVSGVSLDEEMSNLIVYQHTYEAAAQVVSITGKMLDTLMAMS